MKKSKWYLLIVLPVGILILIIFLTNRNNENYITQLNANVIVNDSQLIIHNKDNVDFLNITITINGGFKYAWRGFN